MPAEVIFSASKPLPITVTRVDLTLQQASIALTTLLPAGANSGGVFLVTGYTIITQASGISATLPQCQIQWTDNDTSVLQSGVPITNSTTSDFTGQTPPLGSAVVAGGVGLGVLLINAAANTVIQFTCPGYASSGVPVMQYAVHLRIIKIG